MNESQSSPPSPLASSRAKASRGSATDSLREQINHWLTREQPCPCGVTHAVRTRIVRLDDDAGRAVVDVLRTLERGPRILVVSDTTTHTAAAAAVGTTLRTAGLDVVEYVLEESVHHSVTADDETSAILNDAFRDSQPSALVGVGSGTINDLCKCVASENNTTYVCCPTAASMNGYTSTVASLKCGGLKTTQPVRAPDAVVVDLSVLSRSPRAMTAAGVADLMSKFVSNADWLLGRLIEDGYYCDVPARLASQAAEAVLNDLDAIANGERTGLETLCAALILSGMSMAIAGSSSPASGGEHLISHYWDMTLPSDQDSRLHGAQVGIGSIISATLYEMAQAVDPSKINPAAVADGVEPFERLERDIRDQFGPAADAVIEQARRKHLTPAAARARAQLIKDRWVDIQKEVFSAFKARDALVSILTRVRAPITIDELGYDRRSVEAALMWARHIRARYTVFDFAAEMGRFDDVHRQALLARSGCCPDWKPDA